jgi:hypothetical protein
MKTEILESWPPAYPGLLSALAEFAPIASKLQFAQTDLEGALPVTTPTIAGVKCVACVYADPHKDLPYPRWTVLAPLSVRPGARVSIEGPTGVTHSAPLDAGQIILFDSHSTHWVDKPKDWPSDEEFAALNHVQKESLKRAHLSVLMSIDNHVRPSREQAERAIAEVLHLAPSGRPKKKRRPY